LLSNDATLSDVGPGSKSSLFDIKGVAMKVIIVVGSKHGSTRSIAEAVGDELRESGLDVSIADADADAADVSFDGYDAAVIGSAVYVGRWMKDARNFLEANREPLRKMPLWLFSSGPLGDEAEKPDDLADVRAFAADVQARDHRVFAGSLDKADLNLAERAAVRMVHAPYGDARDWAEVRAWAQTIAAELTNPLGSTSASISKIPGSRFAS
jgi:menaquinone-dependent protoporphyrinogen oxidase